jgi:excisionase family DNA binding protein
MKTKHTKIQCPSIFLTPLQLRDRWQVSAMYLWRMRQEGKLTALKLGRHVRFRLSDIERIEAEAPTE